MVMRMILLILPFNVISHRPISSFIRGKILKKPPKQKWMLMTSEQPAEGKYENNTIRVVWYCCPNSKLRNIYMYTKTSNNPVKKITACPLAGGSTWLSWLFLGNLAAEYFLAVPRQLNRWQCHSENIHCEHVTEWVTPHCRKTLP